MISRRFFLRQAAVASAAITAGAASCAPALPRLSASSLSAVAHWQAEQTRMNAIWDEYSRLDGSHPEKASVYARWKVAYEEAGDALTVMLRALANVGMEE